MSRPETTDVQRLARGRAISKGAFLALLADEPAAGEMTELAAALDIFEAPLSEQDPPDLPFDWTELAAFADDKLPADRRAAVADHLQQHAPDLFPAKDDTFIEFRDTGDTDTFISPPKPKPDGA